MKREDLFNRVSFDMSDLDAFVRDLGGDPIAITQQVEAAFPLPPDVKNRRKGKMYYAPWAETCLYYEIAAKHVSAPSFGVQWAFDMPKDYRSSGPTIILAQVASNMRQFLDMAIAYQQIHTNGVAYSYEDNLDTGEVTGIVSINPLSPPCRQFCEHIMAGIAIMGHRHIPDFSLKRVTFQHNAPNNLSWHEKAFQCPMEFNAARNTIVADRAIMGLDQSTLAMRIAKPLLKTYLNWQLDKHPRAKKTMSATVSTVLPKLLGIQKSDITFVANTLNMHPKKLQRLLADEGMTYSDILDVVRKNIAHRLLTESDISVARLAAMLDYTTDRAFTTAVKRWFDMTPTQYRKHIRDGF